MAIRSVVWCDECGATFFRDRELAQTHYERNNCVPYRLGDRVEFRFGLEVVTGTVSRLGRLVSAGEVRLAYIHSDKQLYEADELHNGYDVYVSLGDIVRKISETQPA